MRFNLYIKKEGWLGLFNYILEKGVFKLKEGYDYVLEGLLSGSKVAYSKVKTRLVAKPWAKQSVTLATEPLVKKLTPKEIKAVEKAYKVSWKKWFGAGWAARSGCLADSLSKWHWLSWQHGENMYPKEGKEGYERPADAKELEVECLGRLVDDLDEALEAVDAERDDELDEVGGAALSQKDVALVKAARDAVGETVDDDDVAALEAAATASDDDARSVAADADAGGPGSMEVDDADTAGGPTATAELSCFAHKKAGSWDLVAEARGRPCYLCAHSLDKKYKKEPKCRFVKFVPRTGKRGTRDRKERGATEKQIQDEQVKACNLVMDEATGLRPDGQTCLACWDAVYKKGGFHGHHAVVGPDETPCPACTRTRYGKPYSAAVETAHLKLKYLADSKAAGNR